MASVHVTNDFEVLVSFSHIEILELVLFDVFLVDGCIGQLCILVVQLVRVIILTSEPEIVFVVEPDFNLWLPGRDTDPLSDVELLLADDER